MDKGLRRALLNVQQATESNILLPNSCLGSDDAGQTIELSLKPESFLGSVPSPGDSLLGQDKWPENRRPEPFGKLALRPGREIEGQCRKEEERQGYINTPASSALLRRICVACHRLSSSAWSGEKKWNQVARTFLYFGKSSRILPAPLTTQVRGSSSTWIGRLVSC